MIDLDRSKKGDKGCSKVVASEEPIISDVQKVAGNAIDQSTDGK